MNELLRLLPVPAERALPAAALERHKAALLRTVEADLCAASQRQRRLARLRSLLGIFFAVVMLAGATLLATEARTDSKPVLAGVTIAAVSAHLVASVAVPLRPAPAFRP